MHTLSTEQHSQTTQFAVAADIARHLAEHVMFGKAVIVTDSPGAMLSKVKQAWRREGPGGWPCSFAVASPGDDDVYAQVLIATPAQCMAYPPNCATMYIACEIERFSLHFMTSWMPSYGRVVFYPGIE